MSCTLLPERKEEKRKRKIKHSDKEWDKRRQSKMSHSVRSAKHQTSHDPSTAIAIITAIITAIDRGQYKTIPFGKASNIARPTTPSSSLFLDVFILFIIPDRHIQHTHVRQKNEKQTNEDENSRTFSVRSMRWPGWLRLYTRSGY